MQLSKFTDFGFRVLITMAQDRQKTTVAKLSVELDVSKNHLSKVVHRLSHLGYIDGMRGRDGGICLKVEPETIKLADLVVGLEGNLDLVPCMDCTKVVKCNINEICLLRLALKEALNTFLKTLGQFTLLDIINQEGNGRAMTSLSAAVKNP